MKTPLVPVVAVATLAAALSFPRTERHVPEPEPAAVTTDAEGNELLSGLPVAFVPNLGQWEHSARYAARIGAMTVFLEEDGWTFTLVERAGKSGNEPAVDAPTTRQPQPEHGRGVAVRMAFAGAGAAELAPESRLPGAHHYFLGDDAEKWRSDVPLYGAVCYREIQPGVDVLAREQDGHFEYDILLAPGGELERVEIVVEGIERMHIDGDGALVLETALGPVRMAPPPSWEEGPLGEKSSIPCRYVLLGADRFGFEAPGRRPDWALVVDPGLVWSTYLGGARIEGAVAVAVDTQGAATVAGETRSPGFPTTTGAFDTTPNGDRDAFVAKLAPDGSSLVYSTFVGGRDTDHAGSLALDAQGAATVVGTTYSNNFPTTTGALDPTHNGSADVFVTRLSSSGASLAYSTFLGGGGGEKAEGVALDAQGAVTVAGWTTSSDFPTTPGAFDETHNGGLYDVFVTRLSPSGGRLAYSTFLGWTGDEEAHAVAVDAQGAATVAGYTTSPDFPTTSGAYDTTFNGSDNVFVTRLSPSGASLAYSTFLGGTSDETAFALALDAQGAVTVAGRTTSPRFPTTRGAFDTTYNGYRDAFVARLSLTGANLVYSTFLGGADGSETALALALDARGAVTVAGGTSSKPFPTTPGAFDRILGAGPTLGALRYDAFVTRLSPSGGSLIYSTFLGGRSDDTAWALALDAQGVATVAGVTSVDFPTTPGAFDTTPNGDRDAFVTRLDMLPVGVTAYGASSPGCTGPLAISVTSWPQIGNAAFSLTCGNAAPGAPGLLALGAARLSTPVAVLGVSLWVDPATPPFVLLPVVSNPLGAADVPLPIPARLRLVGRSVYAQLLWAGPTMPAPCPPQGVSATGALEIVFQP